MSKEDMDAVKKAIAAVDERKKSMRATFVRGGQTGMRQQKLKNYGSSKPNRDLIYPGIKNQVKANHKSIDIVFMHGLEKRYYIADEDAQLVHKLDSKKKFSENLSYDRTSISMNEKSKFVKLLKEKNKGYVFLDMIFPKTDPIMRVVTDSSDPSLIGDKY